MNHIGERMPIQNSMKIRRELHSASDLSQTSEEDFGVKHLRRWRQVLRVARIANNCVRRDPAQQKRRDGRPPAQDPKAAPGGDCWRFVPTLTRNPLSSHL